MTYKISTQIILYIFVALFPIIPSYFSVFGVGGTNFISLLFILSVMAVKKGSIKNIKIKTNYLNWIMLLWVICHFISMVVVNTFIQAVYFLLTSVIVCYILLPLIKNKYVFMNVIKIVVKTSGVLSLFGIIEEFTGFNIFILLNTTGTVLNYNSPRFGMTRIISYSSHAIVYGAYIMFCLSLTFYYLQNISNNRKETITVRFIYALLWINVIFTFSRSAILFTLLSQILLLYFSGFKRFLITILKIVIASIFISVVTAFAIPKVGALITNFMFMILAVFNDKYSSLSASVFSVSGEANATGNRLDLYQWVFETIKADNSWLFGHNLQDTFSYSRTVTDGIYSWTNVKKSLEVQYLNLLYYYGFLGMIPEILVYIALLFKSFGNRKKASWEQTLSFNTVVFVTLGSYFLLFFAVNQSSDKNIFYLFVMLFLAYNVKIKNMKN